MTKVLEVSTAEEVTGHLNSLAITAPDRVTFVKGTCPEEAKWWLAILTAFPKLKVQKQNLKTYIHVSRNVYIVKYLCARLFISKVCMLIYLYSQKISVNLHSINTKKKSLF